MALSKKSKAELVSEVKKLQKKIETLKQSELRFRTLAENATDLIYRCRVYPEFQYEYISPSVKTITGYSANEFYKQPFLGFKIVHPDDVHLLGDSEKLIRQKSKLSNILTQEIIARWIKKDGTIIWTETRTKPVFNEKKQLIAIEGISRDITKQKLSEEGLRESEERFKIISNATFEGILFSENGKIIDANDQFLKMYGFKSSKEIIGKNLIDDFVVEEQKTLARKFLRLPLTKPWEVDTIKKDGTVITVESKGQNIPYFGKTIRATVIYNITERKQYEHSLRESERTLSTLMNNLPGMAFRCDYDEKWTMRFVSKGFQELTGYNPKEIINNKKRSFADIVHPDDRVIGATLIKKAIKTKSPFEVEYRIITLDGKEKWVWEKGEGVFSDKGVLLFLEGFITDVNDKKKNEFALSQSRKNYKSVIDNSPDGILIYKNEKLEFANPTALKMLEAESFEEICLEPMCFFLLPEYHEQAEARMKQMQTEKTLPFLEVKMKTLKNIIKELEAKPIPIQYNGEDAIQIVLHDITAQKQLIKEQLRAQIAEETNEKLQGEITERKNTERILQETQKYTRLLIESSLDMICASDKEGYITEFNAAAQTTFGYELNEVLGKHVSILYANPEERIRITNEELYGTGKYAGEVINLKKNGKTFIAYLSASVLKDHEGKVVGAMGVSRDISEFKRAEEKLRNSEEKYRIIYDHAFVGIAKVSLKGEFVQVNEQLCKMLGYTEQELCSKTFMDITVPEDLEKSEIYLKQLINAERENVSFEKKYRHKNNSIVHCNVAVSVVFGKDQIPQYFISVFENITKRKEAEEKIKAQSVKFNAIIEGTSHVIWTVDKNICLTTFNENYSKQQKLRYGIEAKEGLSMITGDAISTVEYNNFWIKKYESAFAGYSQYFETQFFDKEGTESWREIYLNPIFGKDGQIQEVSGIGHDITEKKKSEEKIRQSLQEKEVLLKEVHHRVKNNLQVISSILNLQSSYVKDESTLNILKESQNRIKSMAFIHESLYQTKDFSSINFSEYIVNLSQNLIHSYSDVGHEVKLNLDIQNVFLNLDLAIPCGLIINEIVSNALKYAFVDKKEDEEIVIKMTLDKDNLVLIIGDNGIGLPKNIDYRNTESLGLQLVVTLTEQLNGKIDLDTHNGTKYTIKFKQNQVKNRI